MITTEYKRILDTFIRNEYKTIRDVAKTLYNEPDELISITYESIVNGNETEWLKESFSTHRIYLFFYISMRNQRNNIYKEKKNLKRTDLKENMKIIDEKNEDIEKYNEILNIVKDLKNNRNITEYQYRIFYLFYSPESLIKINRVNDIHELRNMSLRKLEDLTGINYVSIHYSLKQVINKILTKI